MHFGTGTVGSVTAAARCLNWDFAQFYRYTCAYITLDLEVAQLAFLLTGPGQQTSRDQPSQTNQKHRQIKT
jgi:hypothetical protein